METLRDLEEWLTLISIHVDTSSQLEKPKQKPKIQKVPHMLRKIKANEKCYEPLVVSLGPFHHGNPELEQMEKLKIVMAHRFVVGCKKPIRDIYNKVETVVDKAKECYAAEALNGFDRLDFTKMMFLDGCFILQFIYSITSDADESETKTTMMMKSNDTAFVHRDLFLLENQVPFVVLDALMSIRFTHDERQNMFMRFFQGTQALPPETRRYLNEIMRIFNSMLTGITPKSDELGPDYNKPDDEPHHPQPMHLLDHYRSQLVEEPDRYRGRKISNSKWSSYRSAKELKTVGIHFRPSRTQSFTDVSFQSNLLSGTLWLPPLTVDDSTKSMLLNMVAYETCPDAPDDFAVTSYICLMDALIDQAEDVMELRSKGVLLNLLGSDQQVADLFNEIGNDLAPNPNAYSAVKEEIENHYRNKLNIWIAQWLHAHFSSPWTVFGLLAAIFVIGLTVTQTYFAVFPPPDK
ncbi:hypothetical protein QQ045_007588 [Rhodiola kirilowii]